MASSYDLTATHDSPAAILDSPAVLSGCEALDPVIRAIALSKSFGIRPALYPLSLSIIRGERLAVVGPNGAGKTTLIRLLATLLYPSAGSLNICSFDSAMDGQEIRRRIGVTLHEHLLYGDLTVAENLALFARLYGVASVRDRLAELGDKLGLADLMAVRVRRLSRGQQQRVALARALVHAPPVLLLDEPDTGLDESAFARLASLLLLGAGHTVVVTSHNPSHVLALATRLIFLQGGHAWDLGQAASWTSGELQRVLGEYAV